MEYVKDVFQTVQHDDGTFSSKYMAEMVWPQSKIFAKTFLKECHTLNVECEVSTTGFFVQFTTFSVRGQWDSMVELQKRLKKMAA